MGPFATERQSSPSSLPNRHLRIAGHFHHGQMAAGGLGLERRMKYVAVHSSRELLCGSDRAWLAEPEVFLVPKKVSSVEFQSSAMKVLRSGRFQAARGC